MIEIERKFLVTSQAYQKEATSRKRIVQGFLNTHPERTVRIRIKGTQGFITIKGKSNTEGTSRYEWEKEIALEEANALLLLCEEGIVEKTRFEVLLGNHVYEIDEFHADNEGLIVAEIELSNTSEKFDPPVWLGKEVTGIIKYYNSQLSQNPYKYW